MKRLSYFFTTPKAQRKIKRAIIFPAKNNGTFHCYSLRVSVPSCENIFSFLVFCFSFISLDISRIRWIPPCGTGYWIFVSLPINSKEDPKKQAKP